MSTSPIRLSQGLHVLHLFYNIDRERWHPLSPIECHQTLGRLEEICRTHGNPSHPRVTTYLPVGQKADLALMLLAEDLHLLTRMHREVEHAFPPGTLQRVFSYFSVTELTEYMPTEEDHRKLLAQENLEPGSEPYQRRWEEMERRRKDYEHYRLYPELPDWEVMGFYPMSKRRSGNDNWYQLDFDARKKLMGGHARVGRKYAGRISQLITGSTGLDDWEWGVTLMAHQVDALKEIVYEMRFDEVSARYGEFGPFYISLRLPPAGIWERLRL